MVRGGADTGVVLEQVNGLITLPAVAHFVSHQMFNQNPLVRATDRFLDIFFGIEESVDSLSVARYKSSGHVCAESVFLQLGGGNASVISLAHLHEFLKTAPRFCAFFVFFVRDRGQTIWCVDAYWFRNCWNIDASPMATTGVDVTHRIISPSVPK